MSVLPLKQTSDQTTVRTSCNSGLKVAQSAIGLNYLLSQRRVNCSAYFQGAGTAGRVNPEGKGKFGRDCAVLLTYNSCINSISQVPTNSEIPKFLAARTWIWVFQDRKCTGSPCSFHSFLVLFFLPYADNSPSLNSWNFWTPLTASWLCFSSCLSLF